MSARHIKRALESAQGGALVELAVSLPLLVAILAGTIDFSRVFYTAVSLTTAARAGAQYGAANLIQSGNTSTMQTTATSAVNIPGVVAFASRTCQCATDSGTFSATTTPNDCLSPATTSCPGKHVVMTVTVTASKAFTTAMSILPGVPGSINLVRTATLRVVN